MAEIKNPHFEDRDPGKNPGLAEDWTLEVFNAEEWRYANYQAHDTDPNYYAVERFEGGWGNDDGWIDEFEVGDLLPYDVDGGDVETFELWLGYLMIWTNEFAATDLEAATYSIIGGTADYEAFESDWGHDLPTLGTFLFYLAPWFDGVEADEDPGTGVPEWIISSNADTIRLKLADTINTFETDITITPGSYARAAMIGELQVQTDAALTAAGAPFGPGDIIWETAPGGGLRVRNAKTGGTPVYWFWIEEPTSQSAWSSLFFTLPDLVRARPASDALDRAIYGPGYDWEWFERGWTNDYLDHLWHGTSFIDGFATDPTTFTIVAASNDAFWIYLDDEAGSTYMLQMILAPGVYNLAAMIVEINTRLNAALGGAPAPYSAGNILAAVSPKGQIRIENFGGLVNVNFWLYEPTNTAWPTLGFTLDQMNAFTLPDRNSRRLDADNVAGILWEHALYDLGIRGWEGFEDPSWPPLT